MSPIYRPECPVRKRVDVGSSRLWRHWVVEQSAYLSAYRAAHAQIQQDTRKRAHPSGLGPNCPTPPFSVSQTPGMPKCKANAADSHCVRCQTQLTEISLRWVRILVQSSLCERGCLWVGACVGACDRPVDIVTTPRLVLTHSSVLIPHEHMVVGELI